MHKDVEEVLLSLDQIVEKSEELGKRLSKDYEGKTPVFIALLKGAVPFFAEVIKHIECPMEIDFLDVSSYSGVNSTGKVTIKRDVTTNVTGRHVVFVEDIIDSGRTLSHLASYLKLKGVRSVRTCTLLDKPERRNPAVTLEADYVGFTIPNAFVVGYGLDYNDHYRNLPFVGVLKPEVYM